MMHRGIKVKKQEKICGNCKYWKECIISESGGIRIFSIKWGSCKYNTEKRNVRSSEDYHYLSFNKDFGCIQWEKK